MDTELTAWMELPGARRVRVRVTVFQEPNFPTPNEPEIERMPMVHEWADIVSRMERLDFVKIETR